MQPNHIQSSASSYQMDFTLLCEMLLAAGRWTNHWKVPFSGIKWFNPPSLYKPNMPLLSFKHISYNRTAQSFRRNLSSFRKKRYGIFRIKIVHTKISSSPIVPSTHPWIHHTEEMGQSIRINLRCSVSHVCTGVSRQSSPVSVPIQRQPIVFFKTAYKIRRRDDLPDSKMHVNYALSIAVKKENTSIPGPDPNITRRIFKYRRHMLSVYTRCTGCTPFRPTIKAIMLCPNPQTFWRIEE